MKRRIMIGLLLPLILAAGVAINPSTAAADDSGGVQQCAYGFCYQTEGWQGWRKVNVVINPGNNDSMCVEAFSWNSGVKTKLMNKVRLTKNQANFFSTDWYEGWKDATINATNCSNGKVFTFKVSAWWAPNGFI